MLRLIGHICGRASPAKAFVWSVWLHCAVFVGYCYLASNDILPWTTERPGGAPQMVIYSPPPPEPPAESPATFTAASMPEPQPLPMPTHPPFTIASAPASTFVTKQNLRPARTTTPVRVSAIAAARVVRTPSTSFIPKRHGDAHLAENLPRTRRMEATQLARAALELLPVTEPVTVAPMICMDPASKADLSGNSKPPYPSAAIRLGIEGDVLVRLLISDNGKVQAVEIVESSGHAILDQPTVAWLTKWRGKPARKDGKAVWTYQKQRVSFRL